MTADDITRTRLDAQCITYNKFASPKDLVGYMGALQAQDYPMAKWAIGVRMKDAAEELINKSIDKGEILRTHLLRPTWHFVSSENIYWMLDLTASRIKSSMSSRNRDLELTKEVFKKSKKIIRNALKGNNHLTREELVQILNKGGIKTDLNRASHLFAEAELSGIICSGISKRKKHTYALLDERVPVNKSFNRDEALSKLAGIYFKSRGPATDQDFAWWSGLTLGDAKKAIKMIEQDLTSFQLNSQIYWLINSIPENKKSTKSVFLLPAYDEYLISYKDRNSILVSEDHRKVVSSNGIFRALLIVHGKVMGIWKRTINKDKAIIEMDYFTEPDKKIKNLIANEAERFGFFLNKKIIKVNF